MNSLLRILISRQTSSLIFRRNLASEKPRRAFRSSLIPEKLRPTPRPNNSRPFGFLNERNIILSIIAVNGFVFVVWKFAYANFRSNHDQRLLWFMTKHFSMFEQESIRDDRRGGFFFQWFLGVVSWKKIGFGLC